MVPSLFCLSCFLFQAGEYEGTLSFALDGRLGRVGVLLGFWRPCFFEDLGANNWMPPGQEVIGSMVIGSMAYFTYLWDILG